MAEIPTNNGNIDESEGPVLQILIAEDDDAAAHLIRTNLERTGVRAKFTRAKNGEETLKLLEGGHFSPKDKVVLLLDIRMPKIDGVQVLSHIKSSGHLKKLPVFMLTTSDRPREVDACHRLGCNFYLKKQVDYAKFIESIRTFVAFLGICELPYFGVVGDE